MDKRALCLRVKCRLLVVPPEVLLRLCLCCLWICRLPEDLQMVILREQIQGVQIGGNNDNNDMVNRELVARRPTRP